MVDSIFAQNLSRDLSGSLASRGRLTQRKTVVNAFQVGWMRTYLYLRSGKFPYRKRSSPYESYSMRQPLLSCRRNATSQGACSHSERRRSRCLRLLYLVKERSLSNMWKTCAAALGAKCFPVRAILRANCASPNLFFFFLFCPSTGLNVTLTSKC